MAGCNNAGVLFRDGADGHPPDAEKAIALFKKACPHAATACDNLGALLIGTDERAAATAFQMGCDSEKADEGQAGCCYKLGLLELKGGSPRFVHAAERFRQACDMGVAGACNNLGLMYAEGKGVAADPTRALDYLQRGCDAGDLRACANVGSRYLLGDGAPLDPEKGRALLGKACAGGIAEGCVVPAPGAPR